MTPLPIAEPASGPATGQEPPGRPTHPRHRWLRIALFVALVLSVQAAGSWLAGLIQLEVWPRHSPMLDLLALLIVAAYIVTMALPFVPGIEIGLAIMLVFGNESIPAVYVCTQAALLLSFAVGRFVPLAALTALAGWLQLTRLHAVLGQLEPLLPDERLALMLRRAPRRWVRRLVEHRYLALAVLINLPGNAIVGGAGGIGLVAGMSRVFSLPRYVGIMALATTPLPIMLWIGRPG